jgi:Flp pilus assembly protein TadD
VWVLALYWRALSAPFVYDDLDQIVNNPALGSWYRAFVQFCLAPVSFTNNFRGAGGSTYRPLYWMSLVLDRKVWGEAAWGFHFTNLLVHWVNGCVLFVLARRIGVPVLVAATGVLIWLGLPINSEAVAWVSGRAYLLCCFFLLMSLLAANAYLRYGRRVFLFGYVAGALGALLSHEEGLLLLPLAVLLAYATGRTSRRLLAGLVSAAVLSDIAYLALKYRVGTRAGTGSAELWSVGLVFWKYVQWMVAPVQMSVERSTSTPSNVASAAAVGGWLGMLAVVGAVVLVRKRSPIVAGGVAWGVIALLPFCGVVFLYQGMAERFDYLASAGFALAVATLALESAKAWRGIAVGCLVVWMAWGGWRLKARVVDWGDAAALYESSLKATPDSAMLWYNLGTVRQERGEFGDAAKAYDRALALRPDDMRIVNNLAVTLQQSGDKRRAEQEFRRAIELAPEDSKAYTDLGVLLFEEGRVDDAIKSFQKAMEVKPDDPNPYYDLAVLFQQSGRDELAVPFYRKVLELKPGDPDTITNLSKLHLGR